MLVAHADLSVSFPFGYDWDAIAEQKDYTLRGTGGEKVIIQLQWLNRKLVGMRALTSIDSLVPY
jgi:hypothetical protein